MRPEKPEYERQISSTATCVRRRSQRPSAKDTDSIHASSNGINWLPLRGAAYYAFQVRVRHSILENRVAIYRTILGLKGNTAAFNGVTLKGFISVHSKKMFIQWNVLGFCSFQRTLDGENHLFNRTLRGVKLIFFGQNVPKVAVLYATYLFHFSLVQTFAYTYHVFAVPFWCVFAFTCLPFLFRLYWNYFIQFVVRVNTFGKHKIPTTSPSSLHVSSVSAVSGWRCESLCLGRHHHYFKWSIYFWVH